VSDQRDVIPDDQENRDAAQAVEHADVRLMRRGCDAWGRINWSIEGSEER
jgi:hypothetical protein